MNLKRMRVWPAVWLAGALTVVALTGHPVAQTQNPAGQRWVASWAAATTARTDPAPQAQAQAAPAAAPAPTAPGDPPVAGQSPLHINNQTLRQIVRLSIGGSRLRVVFNNTAGTVPVKIGAAHVARRDKDAAIVTSAASTLTFGGAAAAVIQPGALLVSDPVNLTVADFADLAIDLYLPDDTAAMKSPITTHAASWQTNYLSTAGNHAGAANLPVAAKTLYKRANDGLIGSTWFFLSRVEVMAPAQMTTLVALGDSITDGTASGIDTNNRWPNILAERLLKANIRMAVVNLGIGGNRLLGEGYSALARFDRDVLAQPGVARVIVMEGINDIGGARDNPTPSAADLIAAHRQLIERAHAHGLEIYGATLTPYEGANYYTASGEAKRKALNEWIRTSKAYDGVIDFDAVIRDPNQPTKPLPQYDSGDHLHPNAAGYQAMGNAIDLALFKSAPARASR
jgi:lysophospholipase L1-like esterase